MGSTFTPGGQRWAVGGVPGKEPSGRGVYDGPEAGRVGGHSLGPCWPGAGRAHR